MRLRLDRHRVIGRRVEALLVSLEFAAKDDGLVLVNPAFVLNLALKTVLVDFLDHSAYAAHIEIEHGTTEQTIDEGGLLT